MIDSWFLPCFAFFRRHRVAIPIVLGLAIVLCILALKWIPFDNSIEVMVPEGSQLKRIIRCLHGASFSDKIAISLEDRRAVPDKADLMAAVDRLSAALHPPLITRVETDFANPAFFNDLLFFLRNTPQILSAADLEQIDRQLTPEGVGAQIRRQYLQLLKPEGSFMAAAIRSDPLAIRQRVAERLAQLSASFGYDAVVENGHLLSRDGRHALLVAQTPMSMTDTQASRELVDYLRAALRSLPPAITGEIICGHLHTVSNEDVMKRDITLTMIIESGAFLILFLAFFRDWRAVFIFLIPIVAGIVALPLTFLIVGRLSYLVIGLGAVVAGIAVDYGIHVYVAVRHNPDAAPAIRQALPPITHSVCMVLGIFAAFFFASIPGYHQLAWFAMLSVVGSLLCALFILPQYVRPLADGAPATLKTYFNLIKSRRGNRAVILLWLVSLAAGLPLAWRVPFDSDLMRLDGTAPDILASAEKFQRVWGKGAAKQALAVVAGPTREAAAEGSDRVYAALQATANPERVSSLSAIWPSRVTRTQNAARWQRFWQDGRAQKARDLLARAGARYDFTPQAFDPFFAQLYEGDRVVEPAPDNALYARLQDQFVQKTEDGYNIYTFFPDEPAYVNAFEALHVRDRDDDILISRNALAQALSTAISHQMTRVSLIALGIVILLTFIFIRHDIRMALISLIPVLTAIVWLLALMAVLGLQLNVANLIAGSVVSGMVVDYGVFVAHCCRHRLSTRTDIAITLSSITTLIGTGVLLFAHHPALFSIGLTLVIGVLAGYMSAMLVVPAFFALQQPPGEVA